MTRDAAAALLEAIGARWRLDIRRHSQQVKEAYEPLIAAAPRDGVEVRRDIGYGPHPRQVVDVFVPPALPAHGARVVAFVHGGAFVRGDKRTTEQIYDNVLFWFARQGCVGVNIEYRLAPEASYPAGAEDVASALRWLQARVAKFGGDPARVFLIGHSSGGTHAAAAMFDLALPGNERPQVAGLVLVSARLRADRLAENPNAAGVAAYFGDDATLDEARSPCMQAAGSDVPVMIVVAEFEGPFRRRQHRQRYRGDACLQRMGARDEDDRHPGAEHEGGALADADVGEACRAGWRHSGRVTCPCLFGPIISGRRLGRG